MGLGLRVGVGVGVDLEHLVRGRGEGAVQHGEAAGRCEGMLVPYGAFCSAAASLPNRSAVYYM